jgi:4-amino-4-deoxy-L-arabinose transferase-like glycosyltransferase
MRAGIGTTPRTPRGLPKGWWTRNGYFDGWLPSIRNMQINRKSLIWVILLLGLSALLDMGVAAKASITTDEPLHVSYGVRVLHFEPDHYVGGFSDSQMPISALNAAPQVIASHLESHHLLRPISAVLNHFKVARFPTILATLALNLLVYLWAYDLYGEGPALASCLLCTLSPNLIAHGTLATTDMYHAVGVVGSLFLFRRFLLQPTLTDALLSGLALALAQITKSFALALYAVVYLAIALQMLRRTPLRSLAPRRLLVFTAIAAMWFVAIINLAYSFDRTFMPLGSYYFETTLFNRFQRLPLLGQVPVPFPYPFLQGLDMTKRSEETGRTFGNVYLLGKLGDSDNPAFHGFKSYYAVAFFYKEPIALQILFLFGLIWIFRNRKLDDFIRGEGLLLIAATILVVWLSFFSRAQIGIRHILPALAVETVIAGAAFSNFSSKPWPKKALLSILVLWLGGSVASYYPHMIPYMNEWVRDRRLSYRILADSNLDWGQDEAVVRAFLRKNPDVVLDPNGPVAGRILIRANRLTGVNRWDPSAAFLATYRPVAQVGYAHFLFVVPPEDIVSGPP